MDGMNLNEAREQTRLRIERESEELRKQAVRNEVVRLNQWEENPGLTVEEQRTRYGQNMIRQKKKENEQYRDAVAAYASKEKPRIFGIAEGEPVRKFEPAKKAKCRDRQDRQQGRMAKEILRQQAPENANTAKIQERLDGNSYLMQRELEREITENGSRMAAYGELRERPDYPVLSAFSFVAPKFVERYSTGEYESRKKYLRDMTDGLLRQNFRAEAFDPDTLADNGGQLYAVVMRFKAYRIVYEDPVNRPFFDEMSEAEKQLIKLRILDMADIYENALRLQYRRCGINMDDGRYLTDDALLTAPPEELEAAETFKERVEKRDRETLRIIRDDYEEKVETAQAAVERMQQERKEGLQNGGEQQDVLTGFLVGYAPEEILALREFFVRHIETYEANKPLIDLIEQEFFHVLDARTEYTKDILRHERFRQQIEPEIEDASLLQDTLLGIARQKDEEMNLLQMPLQNRLNLLKNAMRLIILGGEPDNPSVLPVIEEFRRKLQEKQQPVEKKIDRLSAGWKKTHLKPLDDPEWQAHRYYTGERDLREYLIYTYNAEYGDQMEKFGIDAYFDAEVAAKRIQAGDVQMSGGTIRALTKHRLVKNISVLTLMGDIKADKAKEMLSKMSSGKIGVTDHDEETKEGILEYKGAIYSYLKRLEKKYGKLLTQLHPEDVLKRVDFHELVLEMRLAQDMIQLIDNNETGVSFFDDNNPADLDYKILAGYYFHAFTSINAYIQMNASLSDDVTAQTEQKVLIAESMEKARKYEAAVKGPALKAAEVPYYTQNVRESYQKDENYLRSAGFGRW